MDKKTFVAAVITKLPKFDDMRDKECIEGTIKQIYDQGFSLVDALAYCRCLEPVDPDLEEGVALKRMAVIRAKYEK